MMTYLFNKHKGHTTMQELRDKLDSLGIDWHDDSDGFFCRTHIDMPGYNHAFSIIPDIRKGLLGAWHPADKEPTFGLTVDEVIALYERKE